MLQAVVVHEQVHEGHLSPSLQAVTPQIEAEVEGISVPDSGQSEAGAITQIQALPAFTVARDHAFDFWTQASLQYIPGDHSGPTDVAEHGIVDPMVNSICTYANSNNWGACMVCGTDSDTGTHSATDSDSNSDADTGAPRTRG